jgi:hypothetical protein
VFLNVRLNTVVNTVWTRLQVASFSWTSVAVYLPFYTIWFFSQIITGRLHILILNIACYKSTECWKVVTFQKLTASLGRAPNGRTSGVILGTGQFVCVGVARARLRMFMCIIYVYVCYVCISVCVGVYVCMYACVRMYMYAYMYIYMCLCVLCIYVCIGVYVCVYVYMCLCAYMYLYVCIYMYVYACVCVCIYIYPPPKNLPRMQCARAIPVAWLGSGSC